MIFLMIGFYWKTPFTDELQACRKAPLQQQGEYLDNEGL